MAGVFEAATNTWKPSPDADWKLTNIHPVGPDCADGCLIHNPTSWVGEDWPYFQRMDGRWERLCPRHGVGHPDPDVGRFLVNRVGWSVAAAYTHGCCGCCGGYRKA